MRFQKNLSVGSYAALRSLALISLSIFILSTVSAYSQTQAAKAPVVFTEKDREFALKYLGETKDDFVKQITGISDAQLNFRPAPDKWSVAEVAEHIIVSEGTILGLIQGQILKSPENVSDVFRAKDTGVILAITNRSQKFTAPEMLKPAGRFKNREDLLSSFERARNQTIEFVKSNKINMRGHFFENPLMGMIDGYQWLLFLNGHTERHLSQLKEVKANAAYPSK